MELHLIVMLTVLLCGSIFTGLHAGSSWQLSLAGAKMDLGLIRGLQPCLKGIPLLRWLGLAKECCWSVAAELLTCLFLFAAWLEWHSLVGAV